MALTKETAQHMVERAHALLASLGYGEVIITRTQHPHVDTNEWEIWFEFFVDGGSMKVAVLRSYPGLNEYRLVAAALHHLENWNSDPHMTNANYHARSVAIAMDKHERAKRNPRPRY
jgi:hypothetical protein